MENKNESYIVIDKKKLENGFFVGLLSFFMILFIVFTVKGLTGFSFIDLIKGNKQSAINTNLITYYTDYYLNVFYPIPGGNWGLGQVEDLDMSSMQKIVDDSAGLDGVFEVLEDPLKEEVLSCVCFNEQGEEGFRQYMSFTFRANTGYSVGQFIDYCEASFENDLKNSGDYNSLELLSTQVDDYSGVLMKMKMNISTEEEKEDGTKEIINEDVYYTQYVKSLGANLVFCTFGSIIEDDTVDKYMQYFVNNIISDASLRENYISNSGVDTFDLDLSGIDSSNIDLSGDVNNSSDNTSNNVANSIVGSHIYGEDTTENGSSSNSESVENSESPVEVVEEGADING